MRDFTKHLRGNVEGLRLELKMLAAEGEPGGLFTPTGHAGKRFSAFVARALARDYGGHRAVASRPALERRSLA